MPLSSEVHQDAKQDVYSKLGKDIKLEVTDGQHIKCGVIRQGQILLDGNEVSNAHNYKGDKDQGEGSAGTKQYRDKDQYIGETQVDRGHRDGIQSSQK